MLYFIVMILFLISQDVSGKMVQQNSEMELESKIKDLFELEETPHVTVQDDTEVEITPDDTATELEDESTSQEAPFSRFQPAERPGDDEDEESVTTKAIKRKLSNSTSVEVDKSPKKFRNEQVSMSWPILVLIVTMTAAFTCCCTLVVRSRISHCFNFCGKSGRKSRIKAGGDEELGKKKSRFRREKKKPSTTSNRARSLSTAEKLVESLTGIEASVPLALPETPPTGCCGGCCAGCSKKKKREKK